MRDRGGNESKEEYRATRKAELDRRGEKKRRKGRNEEEGQRRDRRAR